MTTTTDTGCPIEMRSARGYCPDDWQGHLDEVCGFAEYADAPFCGGSSMRECEDGSEVPEDQACPDVLDHPTGTPSPIAETAQPPTPPAELPATGTPADLALLAAVALAAGASLLRAVR